MQRNVGINNRNNSIQDALSALSQPIYVSADISETPIQIRREDIVRAACEALVQIEDHVNSGRDRTGLMLADKALQNLEALRGHETKVAALILYSKGISYCNLGQPQHAVESFNEAVKILKGHLEKPEHTCAQLSKGIDQGNDWVLSPLTPVSKLDLWYVQSELLRAYSGCNLRTGKTTSATLNLALSLMQEMEPEKDVKPVAICYAEVLSCYAHYLIALKQETAPNWLDRPLELLQKAYQMQRNATSSDDPKLLHRGLELARLFSHIGEVFKGARILKEVSQYVGPHKLLQVDALWIRASLCIDLLEKVMNSKNLSGDSFSRLKQSCKELAIPVRFVERSNMSLKMTTKLIGVLLKEACEDLGKAGKIIGAEKRDQILPWRRIQILEQEVRIAALFDQPKKIKKLESEIRSLRQLRNNGPGDAGQMES